MGLKGTAMGDITLKGCELPPDAAVGKPGDGAALHKIALLEGCIRYAAFSIGIARTCLNKSLAHSTAKLSGGKPIFRNQEISFKLAEMYMLIDTSSLLARHAAWLHDNSDGRAEAVAMAAKLLAGESASKIAHMAVQIHGGEGYLQETGIERLCRDVRYAELARLSSEQLRMRLADGVLNGIG
jgi:alkylation response protein AidB-like acyl-CoA dehydrogenase